MLENIKSLYVTKKILIHLSEILKLKISKINKKFQNIFDININNYRLFSGKYIINEIKEKTKEYDRLNDKLIFEGEYLNGQRNGKGKEFYFDGQYHLKVNI